MKKITKLIEAYTHLDANVQVKLLYSLLVILILWLIRNAAYRIIHSRIKNVKSRYAWRTGVKNTYFILLFILIGEIWIESVGSFATFFGLVGAGLAIALKDPLANIAGWAFILIRRPFEVGHRIEIGGVAGDVIDIRFFQFTLNEINNWVDADQSTGRIIHIPNGKIFQESQANYTEGFSYIWNEMNVLVTFESNWKKAKTIVNTIITQETEYLSESASKRLMEASKKYMIYYANLTPIVYTSVKDSGVNLALRFLVNPKKRRGTEQKIWEAILEQFAVCEDIDFAYPTHRLYNNLQEGKSETVKKPNFPVV